MVQTMNLQCPYAGGKAVYLARNYIAMVNDSVVYDDANVCFQLGIYRQGATSAKDAIENNFEIIPNPANDKASVIFKNNYDGLCKIIIYDNINRKVFEQAFDCSKQQFDFSTSSLARGIYQVVVDVNGKTTYNNKLTIMR